MSKKINTTFTQYRCTECGNVYSSEWQANECEQKDIFKRNVTPKFNTTDHVIYDNNSKAIGVIVSYCPDFYFKDILNKREQKSIEYCYKIKTNGNMMMDCFESELVLFKTKNDIIEEGKRIKQLANDIHVDGMKVYHQWDQKQCKWIIIIEEI